MLAQYYGIAPLSTANVIIAATIMSNVSGIHVFSRLYHNIIIYIPHHVHAVVRYGHFLVRLFLHRYRYDMTVNDSSVIPGNDVVVLMSVQHDLLHLLLLLLNLLLQLFLLLGESVVQLLLLDERG